MSGGDLAELTLRDQLAWLRDTLADEIAHGATCIRCGGGMTSSTPALAKQLRDTLNQLDSLIVPEASTSDDLKRKRRERQARVAERPTGS